MKIAICEDLPQDARLLQEHLSRYLRDNHLEAELCFYPSGEALLEAFSPRKFQVVFLDIYLERKVSGLDAARRIRADDQDCSIIFTTASDTHAVEGFALRAAHYLVKPVAYSGLQDAMERCRRQLDSFAKTVEVIHNRAPRRLLLRDIRYVEAERRFCTIHMAGEDIGVYMAMEQLGRLLEGETFLRCHRGYIVNLRWVRSMQGDAFEMEGGGSVFISRRLQTKTRQAYNDYIDQLVAGSGAF